MLYAVVDKVPAFVTNWGKRASQLWASRSQKIDLLAATVVVAAVSIPLWSLYSSHMLSESMGRVWAGGSCWADLPIHMHVAESFLQGRNQDVSWGQMHSPVFAGERMVYPFLPDFHAAVIKKLGGSLRDGFLYPGFALACSLWALLYLFALRVTRSRLAGALALVLIIGAGGMGGINHYLQGGYARAVSVDSAQNDVTGDGKLFWFAFIPHVFLPQASGRAREGGTKALTR